MNEEARRLLQLKQEEAKKHQTDVGDEMEKGKESLRSLETEYNNLIGMIVKHRDEQVSGSCLLNIFDCYNSCGIHYYLSVSLININL